MALQRVSIGFSSPQMLAVRMEEGALNGLLEALASGGWHDLTVDGGTIRLNLGEVVYVRTELDEHTVGFGLGA
jgi:hypothetical protein